MSHTYLLLTGFPEPTDRDGIERMAGSHFLGISMLRIQQGRVN